MGNSPSVQECKKCEVKPPVSPNGKIQTVYVLGLEENKFYVGITTNMKKRMAQHFAQVSGEHYGSAWTRLYRPMGVLETLENVPPIYENIMTKQYMAKYGIENVRGGAYCEVNLDADTMKILTVFIREIRSEMGLCFACGGNHYITQCTRRETVSSTVPFIPSVPLAPIDENESPENSQGPSQIPSEQPVEATPVVEPSPVESNIVAFPLGAVCTRCGRKDHSATKCYFAFDVKGQRISITSTFCTRCDRKSHTREYCYAKTHADGRLITN